MKYKENTSLNIIRVGEDEIKIEREDKKIKIDKIEKNDFFDILKLHLIVESDTSLFLIEDANNIKIDILMEVKENVTLDLKEAKQNKKTKIQETFKLEKNAKINHIKFLNLQKGKELNLIYLNGKDSKYNLIQKGIIFNETKLDIIIYHNALKTKGEVSNHFVTKEEGAISLNVTSMVYKKMKDCILRQENDILNDSIQESKITPNLFIEEQEVEAYHSAHIETFNQKQLFYMQTKSIPIKLAKQMMLTCYLKNPIVEVDDIIRKYWG